MDTSGNERRNGIFVNAIELHHVAPHVRDTLWLDLWARRRRDLGGNRPVQIKQRREEQTAAKKRKKLASIQHAVAPGYDSSDHSAIACFFCFLIPRYLARRGIKAPWPCTTEQTRQKSNNGWV